MKNRDLCRVKIVPVGDGCTGKTSLASCFAIGFGTGHYKPTVFDSFQVCRKYNTQN
ncbi:MAG: Rho GTPase, partial [Paramarteilia canceri]